MLDAGRVPWIRPPETGMPDSDVLPDGPLDHLKGDNEGLEDTPALDQESLGG